MTYPVMPAYAASEYFEPEWVDFQSPTADGRVGGVAVGPPLWRGRWSLSRKMSLEASEQWRAFVSRIRGAQLPFFARDLARPWPLKYPNGFGGMTRAGGGAFDGTATSWSVNVTRDTATPTGLPAALALSVGDYAMWRWTTSGEPRRALARVIDAATANGSGVVALRIEPPLPAFVPSGAVMDFAEPCCVMKRVTAEGRLGSKDRTLKVDGEFQAIQDLRP